MDPVRTIRLHWVFGGPGNLEYELTRFRVARSVPTWRPSINLYRCEKCIRICVDLAGVPRAAIDLQVEPKRVVLHGTREAPDANDKKMRALQMLIMEIDYGPFERTIDLPDRIDIDGAHAEQDNGLLWISLPIKS